MFKSCEKVYIIIPFIVQQNFVKIKRHTNEIEQTQNADKMQMLKIYYT